MKRSDAAKKLVEIHNSLFTAEKYNIYTDEELCSMMLERIETEIGMFPPNVEDECSDPSFSIGPSYFEEHVPQRIELGWDDE